MSEAIQKGGTARGMPLRTFLTRLIWLGVLPLVFLAVLVAGRYVYTLQSQQDQEASDRVHNLATALDRELQARIAALQALAASPLMDDPPRLAEFYREAQGFRQSFTGNIILADLSSQMLFNTRVPLGAPLPKLPVPKGHAAVPAVIATGKAAVGDMFFGPIAKEPLVAVVVPVMRQGEMRALLMNILETAQFQKILDELALPAGWSVTLLDGKGAIMARCPAGEGRPTGNGSPRRFTGKIAGSYWSAVLEIPPSTYRAPIVAAGAALAAAILIATLVSFLGGRLAAIRLMRSVETLTRSPSTERPRPTINEIESVRTMLNESARARDRSEESLRESEARFRSLFEAANVGKSVTLPTGEITVNKAFCEMLGYAPEELQNKNWQDVTPSEDIGPVSALLSPLLQGEQDATRFEKRYVHKTGSHVWADVSASMQRDGDGKPLYFIETIVDITDRKRAENKIVQLNNRLQHLIQVIQQLSLAHSLEEIAQAVRTAARRLVEADGATFVLRDGNYCFYMDEDAVSPLWKGRRFPLEICISGWAMLHRESVVIEDIYEDDRIPHDAYRPTFVKSLAMIPIHVDNPYGAIGIYWAKHNRPNEDEMLLIQTLANGTAIAMENVKSYQELENRITERTNELTQANLRLQELDRLKSMFIASMSHELRTPLNSIIGFTGIILMGMSGEISDVQRKQLGMVKNSARHLLDLINDVIDVSKIEAGKAELIIEEFDLGALVVEVKESFAVAAADKGLSLDVQGDLDIRVASDRRRVRQILVNLVGNAVKFTEAGGVIIGVRRAERVPPDADALGDGTGGSEVQSAALGKKNIGVTVADTGVGMAREALARIFEAFSRIHIQGRPVVEGTGLGLYLSKRIADLLGGDISVESEPGKGSAFTLRLPRIHQEQQQ